MVKIKIKKIKNTFNKSVSKTYYQKIKKLKINSIRCENNTYPNIHFFTLME